MTGLPALMPLKRADVMVADFDTELVVLVPDERLAHHLDVGLSLVLDSCDGATEVTAVVAEVVLATGEANDAVESWLTETLATLDRLNVLERAPVDDVATSMTILGRRGLEAEWIGEQR